MMNQAIAYNESSPIGTMDPMQLTVLAYDRVIKDFRQAKKYYLDQLEDEAIQRNLHAQDLVTELLLALDYEQGGDIARNLSKLYDFTIRQLVSMGTGSDVSMYDHLISIFEELREAWIQIGAQKC
jgi:flagellar secretion chaperone FliS